MKTIKNPDPRRCADVEYFSLYGSGVICQCGYFWWDVEPRDEYNDDYRERVTLMCMKDDKPLTSGIIKHTALRGCCSWKPKFEEERKED